MPEQKKPKVHFDHHRVDNNLHLLQSVSTELTTHTTPYQQLCRDDKNKEFQCKVDLFFIKVRLHRNLRSNHNGYQSRFEVGWMLVDVKHNNNNHGTAAILLGKLTDYNNVLHSIKVIWQKMRLTENWKSDSDNYWSAALCWKMSPLGDWEVKGKQFVNIALSVWSLPFFFRGALGEEGLILYRIWKTNIIYLDPFHNVFWLLVKVKVMHFSYFQ